MPRRPRKHLKDPNLCEVYEKGCGPVWADPLGHGFVAVRDLFMEMLRQFSPPVEHDSRPGDPHAPMVPHTRTFSPTGIFSTFHLMTPEQQKVATELYNAIGSAIDTAYHTGLDYGRNLLVQLAKAEIRISDFEQPHRACSNCGTSLPTGNNVCPNCLQTVALRHI